MASQIEQIRELISDAEREAKKTIVSLRDCMTMLNNEKTNIDNSIKGTSTGEDKKAKSSIEGAQKSIKDAIDELDVAIREAKRWANSL